MLSNEQHFVLNMPKELCLPITYYVYLLPIMFTLYINYKHDDRENKLNEMNREYLVNLPTYYFL